MSDPFHQRYLANKEKKKAEHEPLPLPLEVMVKFLASGCYAGYIPVAPGTFGSVAGLVVWYYFSRFPLDPFGKLVVFLGLFFFGVFVCTLAERVYRVGDSSIIVLDEILGILVACSFLTPGTYENEFRLILAIFVLFRLLDILKPFPLKQLEQLPKGWGVMADDLAAGVITLAAIYFFLDSLWIPFLGLQLKQAGI